MRLLTLVPPVPVDLCLADGDARALLSRVTLGLTTTCDLGDTVGLIPLGLIVILLVLTLGHSVIVTSVDGGLALGLAIGLTLEGDC